MEKVKEYLNRLCDLTTTKQIKWVRRLNSAPHIFDCRLDDMRALSLYYDHNIMSRVSLTIVDENGSTVAIGNVNPHGETQKLLFKLWDIVLLLHIDAAAHKWLEALPVVDKKKKFGPKDIIA